MIVRSNAESEDRLTPRVRRELLASRLHADVRHRSDTDTVTTACCKQEVISYYIQSEPPSPHPRRLLAVQTRTALDCYDNAVFRRGVFAA
jgi:hypothetical protein